MCLCSRGPVLDSPQSLIFLMNISVLDRFLKYVSVGSQSDADSRSVPSTPGQTELARLLAGELRAGDILCCGWEQSTLQMHERIPAAQ